MKCTIELAPSGSLRLTTPTGRTLDMEPTTGAVALLRRILYHAGEHGEAPMAYPTQYVLDAWARGREIDWSRREPIVKRTILGDVAKPRKPKPSLRARERKVDLSLVTFNI